MEQYVKSGLVSDSKVLDIRQVDITAGKLLELNSDTLPVFVVTFATQEVRLPVKYHALMPDYCYIIGTPLPQCKDTGGCRW